MKTSLTFFLLFSLSPAWSQDYVTPVSLGELLQETRDPVFSGQKRRENLEFARKNMTAKLVKELGTTEAELNVSFLKNPSKAEFILKNPWYDLQTQFYTNIHLENFQERWSNLQKLHQFSDYGKSLYNTMLARFGQYSPVEEGRFYTRWNKVEMKLGGKTKGFNIPYFLMSKNVNDLISMEAHTPYEEMFPNKTALATFQDSTNGMSRPQKQELAERQQLNRRIYIRAIANSAKTIATIHYLTGELGRQATMTKVSTFLEGYCDECTAKEKKEYVDAALVYSEGMKKTMSVGSIEDLSASFCSSLKQNDYYWNIDRLKPAPVDILRDAKKLVNYYTMHKLKQKNRDAMAKTVLSHDMGVLLITDAINVLDKTLEPIGTKLGCIKETKDNDSLLVKLAIEDAQKNIESYVTRLNRQMSDDKNSVGAITDTLEYFVQTNQTASIEAAATFPQGIGYILKSIAELDRDSIKRKRFDSVVAWGGLVVGVGLTISGIGTGEGVAILISTAGMLKGLSGGSYYLVRTQQEKNFFKEIRTARKGAAGTSDENYRRHYKDYKDLKVNYIKEFAGSAIGFASLHQIALTKVNGDPAMARTLIKKAFIVGYQLGKDDAKDRIQQYIVDALVEAHERASP